MEMSQVCERLVTHPLFQELSANALADVAGYTRLQRYAPETTIVWQGEASTTVSLIVRGLAVVTRLAGDGQQAHVLAYLMPGMSFGEVGILDQQPRSATVQALTEVEVLILNRADFLAILERYPTTAIALARLLGRYLVKADQRHLQEAEPARLMLLFDCGVGPGAVALGHGLAAQLAGSDRATVLVTPQTSGNDAGSAQTGSGAKIVRHPAGYDRLIPGLDPALPVAVQTTLLADQLAGQYQNAVVVRPGTIDATSMVWLMHAQHLVLVVSPTPGGVEQLRQLQHHLGQYTAARQTGDATVIAVPSGGDADQLLDGAADYAIPLSDLPESGAADAAVALPEKVKQVVMAVIERVNRTHQLAVYIPTTIAVDHVTDTTSVVEQTLSFLGARFGGATHTPAQGVWQSDTAGLVQEAVHLVQTYATPEDLHRYLPEVVAYIKMIKTELQQEAMALEVDQRLLLL
jgi:CRP-like cAMP-binding protein